MPSSLGILVESRKSYKLPPSRLRAHTFDGGSEGREDRIMTVLAILGSPRRRGNTAHMLDIMERGLETMGRTMNRVVLADLRILPCQGCWACQGDESRAACVLQDDWAKLVEAMDASACSLYAAPLYGWGVPGPMKTLYDRHVSLVKKAGSPEQFGLLGARTVAQLVTCGSAEANNADLVQTAFHRFTAYARLDDRGAFTHPFCRPDGTLGPGAEDCVEAVLQALCRPKAASR